MELALGELLLAAKRSLESGPAGDLLAGELCLDVQEELVPESTALLVPAGDRLEDDLHHVLGLAAADHGLRVPHLVLDELDARLERLGVVLEEHFHDRTLPVLESEVLDEERHVAFKELGSEGIGEAGGTAELGLRGGREEHGQGNGDGCKQGWTSENHGC